MELRIHRIIESTYAEGPGNRFCIWVQGCSRKCKGCLATQTWPKEGGINYKVNELYEKIRQVPGIEGVTFLGGEPFEQAEALLQLSIKIKEEGLSIIVFTGYKIEELRELNNVYINKLLDIIDVLIDGPFELQNYELKRPWVGSSNQRYIFLTDRYNKEILETKNKIEFKISSNGKMEINGMGDFNKIKEIL